MGRIVSRKEALEIADKIITTAEAERAECNLNDPDAWDEEKRILDVLQDKAYRTKIIQLLKKQSKEWDEEHKKDLQELFSYEQERLRKMEEIDLE